MIDKLATSLFLTLSIHTSVNAQMETFEFQRNGVSEAYLANRQAGTLGVRIGTISKSFNNVLGSDGGTYRSLIRFNDVPALFYETTASSASFTIYYTLKFKGENLVIDCLYGGIRNAQNGISIRKAVCNLDAPLKADYSDLVYNYSDTWIGETNSVSFEPLMAEPPQPLDVPVGNLDDVQVVSRYSSMDDLISATPSTWLIKDTRSRDLGKGLVYFVYDADGKTPLGLDMETNSALHSLKRLNTIEASALTADK